MAQIDSRDGQGRTALLEAIMLGDGSERYVRIVQLLVDANANVNLADSHGETPLQHARSRGYARIERILVAAGGRVSGGVMLARSWRRANRLMQSCPYLPGQMKIL